MKLAVAGKGGSGKTTLSGTLARTFGADGYEVLTIDDDDDPNLAVALGLPDDEEVSGLPDDLLRQADSDGSGLPCELDGSPSGIYEEYGNTAPDGVRLVTAGAVEAGAGCFGNSHLTARLVLSTVEEAPDRVTIVDLPNGIEHLALATAEDVDVMVVVVEPTHNSMQTAGKIEPLARELEIPSLCVVANKVRTDRDEYTVKGYCREHDLEYVGAVPYDDAVRRAEREGVAPVDHDPDGKAVRAIRNLAEELGPTEDRRSVGAEDSRP